MNNDDQFEKRLRQVPQRPVPSQWRADILSAARAAAAVDTSEGAMRTSLLSTIRSQVAALLWPHPKAWAGLAAVWILVLGLNLAARETPRHEAAVYGARPSPQLRQMLKEQQQLYAELVGPRDTAQADHPKPARPQPRSQRRVSGSFRVAGFKFPVGIKESPAFFQLSSWG